MSADAAIITAVLHLISTRGLEETSVRTVAAEAGVSIGAVQHHFRTKADLIAAAMTNVAAAFQEEIGTRLAGVTDPRAALRTIVHLLAGADEDTTAPRIWVAFVARACVDPQIRTLHTDAWRDTERALAGLVAAAHPSLDAADTAALLLALADGLATARASEDAGRMPAERAARLADAALDALG